jgi:hypothetical protein
VFTTMGPYPSRGYRGVTKLPGAVLVAQRAPRRGRSQDVIEHV